MPWQDKVVELETGSPEQIQQILDAGFPLSFIPCPTTHQVHPCGGGKPDRDASIAVLALIAPLIIPAVDSQPDGDGDTAMSPVEDLSPPSSTNESPRLSHLTSSTAKKNTAVTQVRVGARSG